MVKSTVQTFRENITAKIPVILKFPQKPTLRGAPMRILATIYQGKDGKVYAVTDEAVNYVTLRLWGPGGVSSPEVVTPAELAEMQEEEP